MKTSKRRLFFLIPTVVWGLVCLLLRIAMLRTGIDDAGLLKRGNVPYICMWVVSVGFLVYLLGMLRHLEPAKDYAGLFPPCALSGSMAVCGGVLLAAAAVRSMSAEPVMLILALAAAVSMALTGVLRIRGQAPHFLLHGIVCLFFIWRLLRSYQGWSADPQLQEYAFQLLASVALMLTAYHRSSCDAGLLHRRQLAFFGLSACFFCLVSLSDETMPLYYAAAGLWAAGNLGNLNPIGKTPEPEAEA